MASLAPVDEARRPGPARWQRLVVPGGDGLAVLGALLLAGASAAGWVYAALVLAALLVGSAAPPRISLRLGDDVWSITRRLGAPALALLLVVPDRMGAMGVARRFPLTFACVCIGRCLTYAAIRAMRRRGLLAERVLIVGSGRLGVRIAEALVAHREYGLVPVAFADDGPRGPLPLPVSSIADLDRAIRRHGVHRVVVAWSNTPESELVPVLRAGDRGAVPVYVVPRLFELGVSTRRRELDEIWGVPLLRLRTPASHRGAGWQRRCFDVAVALVAIVLTAPVMAVLALAVRCSSPGPVLFRQLRVGQHGRLFQLLKFRTMTVNDDSDSQWSVADDHRVTRVGAFLRRTSLDELPQLFNVVSGSMAIVGPRPERPRFVDQFSATVPGYDDRHRVPAGMTGWAQIHGLRGDSSIEDRALFDNAYIEHWTLWGDVVILLRTIAVVFRGTGA